MRSQTNHFAANIFVIILTFIAAVRKKHECLQNKKYLIFNLKIINLNKNCVNYGQFN